MSDFLACAIASTRSLRTSRMVAPLAEPPHATMCGWLWHCASACSVLPRPMYCRCTHALASGQRQSHMLSMFPSATAIAEEVSLMPLPGIMAAMACGLPLVWQVCTGRPFCRMVSALSYSQATATVSAHTLAAPHQPGSLHCIITRSVGNQSVLETASLCLSTRFHTAWWQNDCA